MHKQVAFVTRLPRGQSGFHYIDLGHSTALDSASAQAGGTRVELADYYPSDQSRWTRAFVAWLGALNKQFASPEWWAHTATAKNLLSSRFGYWLLEVIAIKAVIDALGFKQLYVIGATGAQARMLASSCNQAVHYAIAGRLKSGGNAAKFWVRLAYQGLRVFLAYIAWPWKFRAVKRPDVCLFTYVDGNVRKDTDAFFGTLTAQLRLQRPGLVCVYLAFLHAPFFSTLKKLRTTPDEVYWPLFFELTLRDLCWAAVKTIDARKGVSKLRPPPFGDALDVRDIFQHALWHDIDRGGYFYNLLVFRAARRYAHDCQPDKLIYPYENKSLEKLLILGFRAGYPGCRIDGYQHTSITPRHTTLLFAEDEAASTPLPDRIITAGTLTKQYLETHGNYPAGILSAGCALRQHWRPAFDTPANRGEKPLRVLLALSSSRYELLSAVAFFERIAAPFENRIELLIRPHPEFGLDLLPDKLATWVREHGNDATGTDLSANLAWCDITAYISSTVALETLMIGKPIVYIDIREPINPDPVIGSVGFHARIRDAQDFQNCLTKLRDLSQDSYRAMANEALEYVRGYLCPATPESTRIFLH